MMKEIGDLMVQSMDAGIKTGREVSNIMSQQQHIYHLQGYADRLLGHVQTLQLGLAEKNVEYLDLRKTTRELQEQVAQRDAEIRSLREQLQQKEKIASSLEAKLKQVTDACIAVSANLYAYETAYTNLNAEVHAKHDPAQFASLDPEKRMKTMMQCWKDFRATGKVHYLPDITFTYQNDLPRNPNPADNKCTAKVLHLTAVPTIPAE